MARAHSTLGPVFLPQHRTAREEAAAPRAPEDTYVGASHLCLYFTMVF